MIRRQAIALVAALLLLGAAACRSEDNSIPPAEQQDRIIATASRTDDPSQLQVTWFPVECETFDRVEVELDEQYANLLVKVTVDVEACPPGGFNQAIVDLGEPLGDRLVWDRAFGDTVALSD